jgi:DNA polymerase-3 subunit epsilon
VPVKGKFALLLAAIVLLIGAALGGFAAEIWLGLNADEKDVLERITSDHLAFAIVFALLFVCGLGFVLWTLFKRYVLAANLLADETRIIAFTNASHRVEARGGAEIRRLAEAVNELAARHELLSEHADETALAAREEVETERNTLAALLSELTQGVLVCNPEGLVLLYNSAAAQLFALGAEQLDPNGSLVALGRSVFGLVDRNLVVQKLEDVRRRARQPDPSPVAEFATTTRGGRRLRAQLAPVRGGGQPGGFVLALEDVTVQAEERRRHYAVLQLLAERTRASVAKIRVAAEALGSGADTESEQRRLLREIGEEAQELDAQVDRTLVESSSLMKAEPALDELLASDLLFGLRRSLEARLGVSATTRGPAEDVWLRADGDSVTQAVIHAVGRLRAQLAVDDVALIARPLGSNCRLELAWQAGSGADELLVLELPLVELEPSLEAPGRVAGDEQPAVFDFELFDQALTRPVENASLTMLAYTVFDTETTGLNPSAGDEVISIGAVRIVNGRVLAQETFEQLIDPGRAVPKESQRIHGISPEALDGQPAIEDVLPIFARFAEDTVLVGFDVAFDLRFFELKEAASGIRFDNPVLDTLTLSVVAQPEQEDHSLEAIAARLGVSLVGRHTSLGDAILTGEIFLKLVPLLAARGVVTLKDAREAADQTGLTRARY